MYARAFISDCLSYDISTVDSSRTWAFLSSYIYTYLYSECGELPRALSAHAWGSINSCNTQKCASWQTITTHTGPCECLNCNHIITGLILLIIFITSRYRLDNHECMWLMFTYRLAFNNTRSVPLTSFRPNIGGLNIRQIMRIIFIFNIINMGIPS